MDGNRLDRAIDHVIGHAIRTVNSQFWLEFFTVALAVNAIFTGKLCPDF